MHSGSSSWVRVLYYWADTHTSGFYSSRNRYTPKMTTSTGSDLIYLFSFCSISLYLFVCSVSNNCLWVFFTSFQVYFYFASFMSLFLPSSFPFPSLPLLSFLFLSFSFFSIPLVVEGSCVAQEDVRSQNAQDIFLHLSGFETRRELSRIHWMQILDFQYIGCIWIRSAALSF